MTGDANYIENVLERMQQGDPKAYSILQNVLSAEQAFNEFYGVILDDMKQLARAHFSQGGPQFLKRAFVRCLFSMVEGTIAHAKQILLSANGFLPDLFNEGELAVLKEVKFDLEADGTVCSRPLFPKFEPSFLFVCSLYDRTVGAGIAVDRSSVGWSSFKAALAIRHYLTHPGPGRKLDLDEGDHEAVMRAFEFVRSSCHALVSGHFVFEALALKWAAVKGS